MDLVRLFSVLSTVFFTSLFFAQENYNTLVYKGNHEFDRKNYESATSRYVEAAKLKSNDFTAHYNLGNSFYRRKMYGEATAEYEKAAQHATTLQDKAAALYNLGNAHFESNDTAKAAEFYKQALKQDPYNETIRKNYEIAMLKEKEKQQSKEQQKKGGGGDDQNKNRDKNQQPGNSPQKEAGNGKEDEQNSGQSTPKNNTDRDKIPKDLEKSIMNRVENKERETAKRILNKNSFSMPESNAKDW